MALHSYISTPPDTNEASEISGTGTANTLAKFSAAQVIADSTVTDDGAKVSTVKPILGLNLGGQYATTATAAGTTTLTIASAHVQVFTGATTQTITLPVASTMLQTGLGFWIVNDSTGALTVNSSGSNLVQTITAGSRAFVFAILLSGTSAASWDVIYAPAVTQSITNGDTRPVSSDAVFDADALKVGGNATDNIGYLNVPQNSQADNYTLVLGDSGKHILETGASKTVTIPANASVAFPIGSAITVIPTNATGCSVAITTDTLIWADGGGTGTRTLAQYAMFTAIKTASTTWICSGVGVS